MCAGPYGSKRLTQLLNAAIPVRSSPGQDNTPPGAVITASIALATALCISRSEGSERLSGSDLVAISRALFISQCTVPHRVDPGFSFPFGFFLVLALSQDYLRDFVQLAREINNVAGLDKIRFEMTLEALCAKRKEQANRRKQFSQCVHLLFAGLFAVDR